MSVLVIAEHHQGQLKPSTLNAVTAAVKIGGDVHMLVMGFQIAPIVETAAKIQGVAKVLAADSVTFENMLSEAVSPLVAGIAKNYTHVVMSATAFGKNILPRVAGLIDMQPISDVIDIVSPDTFKRPVYAGNAIATVQSSDVLKLLTVRTTAFDAAPSGGSASIENITAQGAAVSTLFVVEEITKSARPELTAAKIIVSGGRALGSADNFSLIEKLADKLGGAVGASRAAVDAGYAPNDYQVGQTGKIVAPSLYIAVGISGAIQHLAGMKESKIIVAINKDPDAPIFQVADYGLVADLFDAVPEMTTKL